MQGEVSIPRIKIGLAAPEGRGRRDGYENLALSYIEGSLKKCNKVQVRLINRMGIMKNTEIVKELVEFQPDIIGFTLHSVKLIDSLSELIKLTKRSFRYLCVVGGHYMMFRAKEIAEQIPEIDVIVFHEGENIILDIISAYIDKGSLEKVKGLMFRRNNSMINTGPRPKIENIDSLPFPTREKGDMVYSIISSRGCYCECSFCSIRQFNRGCPGKDFRIRSIDSIESELAELKNLNAKVVSFVDDIFLLPGKKGWERAKNIADIMNKLSFKWAFGCRPTELTEEILSYCVSRGLCNVGLGIESGSNDVLIRFNKKIKVKDSARAIKLCHKYDVSIMPYFIMFEPDMTKKDIKLNFNFLAKHGLLWPSKAGNVLVPYPGTPAYNKLSKQNRLIEKNNQFKMIFKYPDVEEYMLKILSPLREAFMVEYKLRKIEFQTDIKEIPDADIKRKVVRKSFRKLSNITWEFMNNTMENPQNDDAECFLQNIQRLEKSIPS